MQFNDLERKFFEKILNAELDVPVHATLEYEGQEFEIIIVPKVTEQGDFTLKYYNATPYVPEPEVHESGVSTRSWPLKQAFGSHPKLEQAWRNGDTVTVEMRRSPLPIEPDTSLVLTTQVLYAGVQHRGELRLYENQLALQKSSLKRAEFSVVDFPEFESPYRSWESIAGIGAQEHKILRSLADKLEGDAKICVISSPHQVILDDGNEWSIKLTRDEQQTRDLIGHTGLIEKADETEFDVDELCEIMEGLKYFFAFVAGTYCLPTSVIGYDSRNWPIWGEVGRFTSDRRYLTNWFSNTHSVRQSITLEKLFPGFWNMWRQHKEEIIAIIECYVHSNEMSNAGVSKDAVAKSYAGLEILAGLALGKTILGNSDEKIHDVLSNYQMPHLNLNLAETPVIASLCKVLSEPQMRGVYLLCGVRNYVGHPLDPKTPTEIKKQYRKALDDYPENYFYLHDLSQFYLEYTLLKFFGYCSRGDYRKLLS